MSLSLVYGGRARVKALDAALGASAGTGPAGTGLPSLPVASRRPASRSSRVPITVGFRRSIGEGWRAQA